jgi:protein-S-isoprenylcysteine O-methyltransferase
MKLPSPMLLGMVYLASEIILSIMKRSREGAASRDAHSLGLIWLVISLSMVAGVFLAGNSAATVLPHRRFFATAGLVLFVGGLVLRWVSIIQLGRFFTVNVAIAADHRLIESGPYRFVRHPSYTGSLLAFLGFALSLGNWLSVLVIMIPITIVFLYRINVEERALTSALGDTYISYCGRTKRLLPLLY